MNLVALRRVIQSPYSIGNNHEAIYFFCSFSFAESRMPVKDSMIKKMLNTICCPHESDEINPPHEHGI